MSRTLYHYTSSYSDLCSILREGIYYTHNETELTRRLAGPQHEQARMFDPGGMVSFTELPIHEAKKLGLHLGNFGIGIDRDWAISMGCRPVDYVSEDSEAYAELRREFDRYQPRISVPSGDTVEAFAQQVFGEMIVSNPDWAAQGGTHFRYVQLLDRLKWLQIGGHAVEREWRMRSDIGYPDVRNIETQQGVDPQPPRQQIKLLRFYVALGMNPRVVRVPIPPEACTALVVPASRLSQFVDHVAKTPFSQCPITTG